MEKVVVSSYSQTEEEKKESQEEVQTDVEEGHHAETQTIVVEMVDAEVVTVVSTLLVGSSCVHGNSMHLIQKKPINPLYAS